MSFSADWLELREPADLTARNADIISAVGAYFARSTAVRITDLASGLGSTMRAVAPHLPLGQSWTLVDYDAGLLAAAAALSSGEGTTVSTRHADLREGLADVLAHSADLVTTSAFFDLVSEDWLARFVAMAAQKRLPVYAALSYDGRMACAPQDDLDAACGAVFNRHQRGDKGFGPALGPQATERARALFEAAGYRVALGPSDWHLGPDDAELQRQLIAGWHDAVAELGDVPTEALSAWRARKFAAISEGRHELIVGHLDLWAVPA